MRKYLIFFLFVTLNISLYAFEKRDFGNLSEFLNVETHFVFENNQTQNRISNIYGATSFSVGDGVPISYGINEKLVFYIEFFPTVLSENKLELKNYTKSPDSIDIPVSIEITSKNSKVNLIDTKSIYNVEKKKNVEHGSMIYNFLIKNKIESNRYIKFEITGLTEGEEEISISYGCPDYKIVESSCNVFETIEFTK